jgi:hypothetical protein
MRSTNLYNNGIPQFGGQNYSFWRIRMKTYVQAQGFSVWKSIVDGYKETSTPPIDNDGKKLRKSNLRDKNAILNGLVDSVYVKVMHYDFAKDIWEKNQNVYEEDAKVKASNIQTYRGQFE